MRQISEDRRVNFEVGSERAVPVPSVVPFRMVPYLKRYTVLNIRERLDGYSTNFFKAYVSYARLKKLGKKSRTLLNATTEISRIAAQHRSHVFFRLREMRMYVDC